MELIVAVYDNWGIGKDGTQPVALSADRKFFREMTKGATVIAGRKTVEDFPGKKPLPGRENVVLSRSVKELPGFTVCKDVEEVLRHTKDAPRVMVIGGGSVYRQLLDYCDKAYVTKVHCFVPSDTDFPNLDEDPRWEQTAVLQSGQEQDISYEMCLYEKK